MNALRVLTIFVVLMGPIAASACSDHSQDVANTLSMILNESVVSGAGFNSATFTGSQGADGRFSVLTVEVVLGTTTYTATFDTTGRPDKGPYLDGWIEDMVDLGDRIKNPTSPQPDAEYYDPGPVYVPPVVEQEFSG